MPAVLQVYTVGHSTRSAEAFAVLLRAYGVETVVDVRRFPASRRYPHFAKEPLAGALGRAGVAYEHEPTLGGRREARHDSPNAGIRSASFRGYADHALTEAFGAALDRVMDRAARGRTALMCAEAVPWRCHRQILADHLVARGVEVVHILAAARAAPHELSPLARPAPGGGVRYPDPGDQMELWAGAGAAE